MKITYDKEADALYIYFDRDQGKKVSYTYTCDPIKCGGMINIDFSQDKKIDGFEILDASKKVPKSFFEANTIEYL